MPRRHATVASLYSRHITRISIPTPTTTNTVNSGNNRSQNPDDLSRVVIAFSRADMELSKEEASVGRLEAPQIKCAKITVGSPSLFSWRKDRHSESSASDREGVNACGDQTVPLPADRLGRRTKGELAIFFL